MRRADGFSLIEMLVAMTLLALVFVLLFGGLRFGVRAWERGATVGDSVNEIRSAHDFIRNAVLRACPSITASSADAAPIAGFSGSGTRIDLRAPAPQSAGGAPCAAMTLSLERDGKLSRLAVAIGDVRSDLLRDVRAASFAYLGADGIWRDTWSGMPELPRLVRLRVTFNQGDVRQWPELFVAPRISGGADCTYDPRIKSCRGGE